MDACLPYGLQLPTPNAHAFVPLIAPLTSYVPLVRLSSVIFYGRVVIHNIIVIDDEMDDG
jgi:hypothetical protein